MSGNGCENCTDGATHADWWQFEATENGVMSISSCSFFGPDTRLWVYTGDCNNLVPFANDADGCGFLFGNGATIDEMFAEAGKTYFFEWDNATDSVAFEFDFTFEAIVGCGNPLGLDADSVTSSSARINWTSVNEPASFMLEYGPFGFAPGTGTIINGTIGVDGPPVVINGLTENTFYQVRLAETCSQGTSDTLQAFFRTNFACRTPLNFFFDTDSIAPDYARVNWASFNNGSEFIFEYGEEGFAPGTGTKVTGTVGVDGPPVDIFGLNERTTYDYYYQEICENGASDTVGPLNFTTTAWCPDPDNFEIIQSGDDFVTVDWESNNNSTFTIEYGAPGFTPGTGTIITGNTADKPITINGLSAETFYHAYILEACSNNFDSDSIPFTFNTPYGPVTNDSCGTATTLRCGNVYTGSTETATNGDNPEGFCGTIAFGPGVWFTLVGSDQSHTLSLCNSDFDTELMVFEGSCDSLVCVGGNAESNNCPNGQSEFTFESETGKTYYVFVGSLFGETGNYQLEVSCGPLCSPKPSNDDCSSAEILSVMPQLACAFTEGSNSCASQNPDFNFCAFFETVQDVWYQFTTNSSGALPHNVTLQFDEEKSFNFAVYNTCGGNQIDCQTDVTSGEEIEIGTLDANTTYYVQVWNEGGDAAGDFEICISEGTPTGINNQSLIAKEITMFPNPANNLIQFKGINESSDLLVMDVSGKVVMNTTVTTSQTIDISSLQKGVYQVVIKGQQNFSTKLIKQ